jgi:hypothetical protein
MITAASCKAHLDSGGYHGNCIFSPRHRGSHFDGLVYWEPKSSPELQTAGERAAEVLGLVRRRRAGRPELVVEFSEGRR